jgi:hypothetical protein
LFAIKHFLICEQQLTVVEGILVFLRCLRAKMKVGRARSYIMRTWNPMLMLNIKRSFYSSPKFSFLFLIFLGVYTHSNSATIIIQSKYRRLYHISVLKIIGSNSLIMKVVIDIKISWQFQRIVKYVEAWFGKRK